MASIANLNGIVLIDKPSGPSSHDIVNKVRYLLKPSRIKVGHTGTLDPFARGLLIIALGSATRLIQYSHTLPKSYSATAILGTSSSTDDLTGTLSPLTNAPLITLADIQKVLPQFTGKIAQTPPAYSAVKINGQPLYKLARHGNLTEAQRKAGERGRIVTIYDIQITEFSYPELHLHINCGTGTYIRSLVRDIGNALSTTAYVSALTRVTTGKFHISDNEVIHNLSTEVIHNNILPPETLIDHLPKLYLDQNSVAQLQQGRAVPTLTPPNLSPYYAIFSPQKRLIGISTFDPDTNLLRPKTILSHPSTPISS